MKDPVLQDAIAAQRHELATVLTGLTPEQWDAPTLCAGWRVREVVAHVTMPFRYSVARFVVEMVKARGDFNRMADRAARRDAAGMSAADLIAAVRDNAHHPWQPPGGGFTGALNHDLIHGLDITVPLGIDRHLPEDRVRLMLRGLSTPKSLRFFAVDLGGVELRADDMDWHLGSGTPMRCRPGVRISCWFSAVASCHPSGYGATCLPGSSTPELLDARARRRPGYSTPELLDA